MEWRMDALEDPETIHRMILTPYKPVEHVRFTMFRGRSSVIHWSQGAVTYRMRDAYEDEVSLCKGEYLAYLDEDLFERAVLPDRWTKTVHWPRDEPTPDKDDGNDARKSFIARIARDLGLEKYLRDPAQVTSVHMDNLDEAKIEQIMTQVWSNDASTPLLTAGALLTQETLEQACEKIQEYVDKSGSIVLHPTSVVRVEDPEYERISKQRLEALQRSVHEIGDDVRAKIAGRLFDKYR
jgi:hypothetical protein